MIPVATTNSFGLCLRKNRDFSQHMKFLYTLGALPQEGKIMDCADNVS